MSLFLFPKTKNKFIRIIKNILVFSFVLLSVFMLLILALPSFSKQIYNFMVLFSTLFCISLVILVFYGIGVLCRAIYTEQKQAKEYKKIRKAQEILERETKESKFLFNREDDYCDYYNDVQHYLKMEYFLTQDGKIILKKTTGWHDVHNIIRGSSSIFFQYISFDEFNDRVKAYNDNNTKKYAGISESNYLDYINNDLCQNKGVKTKKWIRLATGYDGGFTEFYFELHKVYGLLKLKEISYHYNANEETLLDEISIPEELVSCDEIIKFIIENIPNRYNVDIKSLKENEELIYFISDRV